MSINSISDNECVNKGKRFTELDLEFVVAQVANCKLTTQQIEFVLTSAKRIALGEITMQEALDLYDSDPILSGKNDNNILTNIESNAA